MSIQNTAALLLKMALQQVFPASREVAIESDKEGFSVSFSYPDQFQEAYLDLLERKMKEHKEFEVMEMLPINAVEYCKYHGFTRLAQTIPQTKTPLFLVKWECAVDISFLPLSSCPYFSLLEIVQTKKQVKVKGRAFEGEKEKKEFLKKWRAYREKNHSIYGKQLELYQGDEWDPRGIVLRNLILDIWRKFLQKEGIEEVETLDPAYYYQRTKRAKFCQLKENRDQIYFFEQESLISLLHLIQKWINIFHFKTRWVYASRNGQKLKEALKTCGIEGEEGEISASLQIEIADSLGRYRPGPRLELKEKKRLTLFGELKEFTSLLLEHYEGQLPFWLQPVQVVFLPLKGVETKEVVEIFNRLQIRYIVDERPLDLKEKIYLALRMKVPYVMVFGKQEEKSKQIQVRPCGSSQEKTMTMKNLEVFLSERALENQ